MSFRRLFAGLLLTGVLLASFATVDPTEAAGQTPRGVSSEQQQVRADVNETRRANGMSALVMNVEFANKAQQWAQRLANCRCLEHRAPPFGAPAGWYAAAENVARGFSLDQIHRTFMASAPHKANILTRRFTHIGTGVARSATGEIFVVQAFMDRSA
jgi:uncharacterized protein YkwD